MNPPLPQHYAVVIEFSGDYPGRLLAGTRPELACGPPPQFGGSGDWWDPEHLFLASINACFMTTFQAVARKSRLQVVHYESRAEGTLDKSSDGLGFTGLTLRVSVRVAGTDFEKVDRLLGLAKKHCIVSNSLKIPVEVHASVLAAGAGPGRDPPSPPVSV